MAEKKRDKLEHTEGGTTTRDDALDAGVPMLPGSPNEPVGPEDAFGPGPKRGDYSDRLNAGPHLVSVAIPNAKPGEAHTKLVPVDDLVKDIGDVPGKKGGIETA